MPDPKRLYDVELKFLKNIPNFKKCYVSRNCKGVCGLSYGSLTASKLESLGLVKSTKEKRIRVIELTEKGKRVIELYNEIEKLLDEL